MAFNPLQWAGDVWQWATGPSNSPTVSDEAPQKKEPTAQPFFVCPSCLYVREETPEGQKFCSQCQTEFSREDTALLPQAQKWLNDCLRGQSLNNLTTLAEEKDGLRRLMQPFFDDLANVDQSGLKVELESAGFHGRNTFEMLLHWARTRLSDRVRHKTLSAMNRPPIYFVRGGLPGLGK